MHYITIKNFFEQYNALIINFFSFFYGVVKNPGSQLDSTSIGSHVPLPLASVLKTYVASFCTVSIFKPIVDGSPSATPGVTLIPVPALYVLLFDSKELTF